MAGFGPGGHMGPPPNHAEDKNREPKPKNIKEVPHYLKKIVGSFFSRLFYIFGLVWETNPWILIVLIFVALLNGLLPVAGTYITAEIINALLPDTMAGIGLSIGVLFVLQFIHQFLNRITTEVNQIVMRLSGELVTNHIRRKIMRKAKEVDISCFDLPDFYEKLENANREAGMRPVQILNSALSIVSTVISIIIYMVVLLQISVVAPLIVGVLALPYAIVSYVYRRKTVKYMYRRSKARRQMNYYSSAVVNKDMVKEMRLLGIADDFEARYDETFKDYFKGLKKLIFEEGAWNIGFGLLRILSNCFLLYFIATLVMKPENGILIGDYSFYTGAISSIGMGITSFISGTATVYEGTLFIDNLISFMKHESSIVSVENAIMPKKGIAHTIEFKNVSFKYPGAEKLVLENFDFILKPGETVALVGLNGAGKTTIIKLLTRLYDPTDGAILLDGVNIKEYDVKALYELFGVVFQDFGRYAVTVKENITFGNIKREVSDEAVIDAAKQSNAFDYVNSLPQKFDTPLMRVFEEDGTELSVGQWQKIAVARAFYSDADILILDEPTASLDALAEQEIFRQFDKLRDGKTTLFVSHRLSSAVDADRIVVIKNGKVIEDGNHRQLMAQKGEYEKMFSAQAEKYNKQ